MSYNWNDVALEMSPVAPYMDVYSNQPRIYMFEGANLIDLLLLLFTSILLLFWLLFIFFATPSATKSLIIITTTQILLNSLIRAFKSITLLLVAYPTFSTLFVASSVETTLHYTLYLQYTSSILVFMWIREKDFFSKYTNFYFIPSLFFSIFVSVLNVNFNNLLMNIPFYIYVIFYVGMSLSNLIILIIVLTSCLKIQKSKVFTRLRLFLFILIASPPILFNTSVTVMDLLYMVVEVSEDFPIPYIILTTYRYKAFEITPVAILIAFFALLPDLRKQYKQGPVSVVTAGIIHCDPNSSQSSKTNTTIYTNSSRPVSTKNTVSNQESVTTTEVIKYDPITSQSSTTSSKPVSTKNSVSNQESITTTEVIKYDPITSQSSTTSSKPVSANDTVSNPESVIDPLPSEYSTINPSGITSTKNTVPYLPNYNGYSTGELVVHIQAYN